MQKNIKNTAYHLSPTHGIGLKLSDPCNASYTKMQFLVIVGFLLLISYPGILAQEKQKAVTVNTVLQKQNILQPSSRLKSTQSTTVELPFIDDFSSATVYPNPACWSDNNVFINSTFAIHMKTIGVASFDVFDAQGNIYQNIQKDAFGADTLTSNPINLNYPPTSAIWMSFYIQPGGLGDEPGVSDSLKLEFFMTDSGKWKNVWSTPGFSSPTFSFKSIPINQPEYLKNGFRFRFINLASLTVSDIEGKTSIPDVWNLDYVKIDTGRNENDSIFRDVAFSKPLKSLLKSYYAMPWSHYLFAFIQEVEPKIEITYVNLDSSSHLPVRLFKIKELHASEVIDFDIGGLKILPWEQSTFQADLTNPFKSKNTDSAEYEVMSMLKNDITVVNKWNDTVKFKQVFKNYFAYDDGSSESGYGIAGQGAQNAMAAYGFYSYFPDTLRSVYISFNPTENNITESYYFRLAVWSDNNGKPGSIIYIDPRDRSPIISRRGEFAKFDLDSGIVVNETFFIGWIQSSEDYLNIGYDLNNPNGQSHLFYNLDGTWIQSGVSSSVKPGSLMIRPIMRTENLAVGIPPIGNPKENAFTVFPNPAKDYIVIDGNDLHPEDKIVRITIFNTLGQPLKIIDAPSGNIDIGELNHGVYIIKIQTKKGKTKTLKLLKEI